MNPPSLSIIIPTIGRPSLQRCLDSLATQVFGLKDEVLLVCDGERRPDVELMFQERRFPGRCWHTEKQLGFWGHGIRNHLQSEAVPKADFIVSMDDDDIFMPGALQTIRTVLLENPDLPHFFKIHLHTLHGSVMWGCKLIQPSIVGTLNMVYPNVPGKFGNWAYYYGGDFDAIYGVCTAHGHHIWSDKFIAVWRPDPGIEDAWKSPKVIETTQPPQQDFPQH